MALTESNQYGATFLFGVTDADAPTIAGMKVRSVQIKFAAQVKETSPDGEGHVESITVSKPVKRMATATFTGKVTDAAAFAAVPDFTWTNTSVPNNTFWIITTPGCNREAGKYAEASIEAESYPGITGAAPAGS